MIEHSFQKYTRPILQQIYSAQATNNCYFIRKDLKYLPLNNDKKNIELLNTRLNTLAEKNIRLIVLPSPDKYDLYYNYIKNKANYPKPLFFSLMSTFHKKYLYIDTKKVFQHALNNTKDIYFYDDTHWSRRGSKLIAKEIANMIQ